MRCDNATKIVSTEMKQFPNEMGFIITISSPHYPQAEMAVGMSVVKTY